MKTSRWFALVFLVLAQFMIVLDISILNVALPSIQRDFNLGVTSLQWIVTAYTLAFGGFLLLGGRAADLYGRRRVFIIGTVAFTLISFSIGVLNNAALLMPLRALQGLAAAFMSPSALSLVLTLFREPQERARALSIWGAVSAGGATVGLLLGGILTQYLSWRWNFFVNVPIGIVVVGAAMYLCPKHAKEERTATLDIFGGLLITGGLMSLVYTLSEATSWGWLSSETILFFTLSLILLGGFVFNESRVRYPLMPLSIFKVGNVAAADFVQLPVSASLFSSFFFLSLYVQNVMQYSPLQAGLSFLPMSLTIATIAILAPRFIGYVGYKTLLVVGPFLVAVGLFFLTHLPVSADYVSNILPTLLIMGAGLGVTFVSLTIAATSGVPGHESGLASGLLNTSQQVGGSLGLAILSSIAAATTQSLAGSESATTALVGGFHSAFYVSVFFAIGASVCALLFIRRISHRAEEPIVIGA